MKQKSGKSPDTTIRRKTDILWCALIGLSFWAIGDQWAYSSEEEAKIFLSLINVFGFESRVAAFASYYVVAVFALSSITAGLWFMMKWVHPNTPSTHLGAQMRDALTNFFLLATYQVAWDVLAIRGYTKQTLGDLQPYPLVRDVVLWQLAFELAWYTQHRLMHDVKPLWTYGHSYHHEWKKPEHMIGITNFAFDHIVEPFVTMSSSLFPILVFPCNFYVNKIMGFGYMIFAVLVHWDHFEFSRYHLNHHYLVTKNYGSHWPIFDILFGTYQKEVYIPKDRY